MPVSKKTSQQFSDSTKQQYIFDISKDFKTLKLGLFIHFKVLLPAVSIGHFRVAVNFIMKARLSAKAFHMKISFVYI